MALQVSRKGRKIRHLLIGVLVIVVLILLVAPSCPFLLEDAKPDRAMADMKTIHTIIKLYKKRLDRFPASLDELVEPSGGGPPFLDGGESALLDPWGKQYQFEAHTDAEGKDHVVVWTTSPDGERIQWPRK